MSEFLIREAVDADGPALSRLIADARASGGEALAPPEDAAFEQPARYFEERGGRLWLVMRDGTAVGSFGLIAHDERAEFELAMICLEPAARGQGLAAALLAGANAFAAASGAIRLSVWVDVAAEDLHRFCERHEFLREPGVRARRDGSETLEACFSRPVR
ncbi:GNAT family N-acetyltransferase [Hansschlegelia quercus]|uniref:GNAT family N-acetyltransferase n=1 Tax=Hansschlegelia quercus TaxID=2528245 RepID=A0A4Q9GL19_9HYPH|nr:GNAT family N-acetyltransferase [Hansschlegelia quercus]TBN55089.1 GNAT family N-acetyltransferase [Hansschlegelia quercus]